MIAKINTFINHISGIFVTRRFYSIDALRYKKLFSGVCFGIYISCKVLADFFPLCLGGLFDDCDVIDTKYFQFRVRIF